MEPRFDIADLATVCQQWAEGAKEKLDAYAEQDASPIDLRDAALFLSGCFCGCLQVAGITSAEVNQRVHEFQTALDEHLQARFPEHPKTLWRSNALH